MKAFVEQLAIYLENASVEQLRKDWEDLKSYNGIGDYVSCYLYKIQSCVGVGEMVETMCLNIEKSISNEIKLV